MPPTDPTPIPAEAIEAVISAMDRHITDEFDGLIPVCRCGSREDDHEARVILAAVAPILLAERAAGIPGWAHEQTVTFDGDTHWLECDFCSTSVHGIDAGDSLETIMTKARDHRRTCASANGDDRG